ncbi:hypothetical protein ACODUO_15080 [Stenotrophomonas maltophilia]
MSKHTKGPWKWKSDQRMGGFHVYMDTAIGKRSGYESHHHLEMDFSLYPEDGEQWEEAKANARLIAAAPELLEALSNFPSDADYSSSDEFWKATVHWWLTEAEPAIAKATGEA